VVQRRRRWTTEQKLALVEEAMRPGSSVAGVADRHGVSRSLLFEWRQAHGISCGVALAAAGGAGAAALHLLQSWKERKQQVGRRLLLP
jgi:transposase